MRVTEGGLYVSPWWQAVLLPDVVDVAGVECSPLTLWHLFALENLGNPYACGGLRDRDAAACLLIVAGGNMRRGRYLIHSPGPLAREMRRMNRRLRRMPFDMVDAACVDYFSSCTRHPDHAYEVGAGGKIKGGLMRTPWQYLIVDRLSGGDPTKYAAAWNMPFAIARCMYDAWRESTGTRTLVDDVAQRGIDDWKEQDAMARRN